MTKKISSIIGLSVSALFFAQDVSVIRNTTEVYGNNYNEIGTARYTAMGGSMGALGGDISTFNSNPAGLGVFILDEISGSLHISSAKNTSSLANYSNTQSNNKSSFGQVGGAISFASSRNSSWKFVNVGFAYNSQRLNQRIVSPQNHNIAQPYPNGSSTPTDYDLFSGHLYERTGHRTKINFSIGGNYENKIYVGAGVNIVSAEIQQLDDIKLSSKNNPAKWGYYRRQNTPFIEDATGVSLSFGVIGKLGKSVRLGAAIESPTWWKMEREYKYYETSPSAPNSYNAYVAVEDRKLSTPTKLTLSGAVVPNKHFAFNVDYRVDLGKPSFSGGAAENQLNGFYNSTYKAQQEVRFGAEYRHSGFSVRGGYSFVTSPFSNYTYSYAAGSNNGVFNNDGTIRNSGSLSNFIVGKSNVISGGIGYDFKTFFVDATYQHITQVHSNPFFAGTYVYDSFPTKDISTSNASIVSDVKTKKGNIILTLGWKF